MRRKAAVGVGVRDQFDRRATQLHRKAVVAIRRRPNVPLITIYNRVVKFQSALHLIRLYRLSS